MLEQRDDGVVAEQYVWDLRYIDAPVLRETASGVLYYTQDANFNVTGLVDETTGDVVERYHYDPYGKAIYFNGTWAALAVQESAQENDYLYTGRRLDPETGLMYYRARYYDVALGRFISRDPSEYDGSPWNLYEYVQSGPTAANDPTGLIKSFSKKDGYDLAFLVNVGLRGSYIWGDGRWSDPIGRGDGSIEFSKEASLIRVTHRIWSYGNGGLLESRGVCNSVWGDEFGSPSDAGDTILALYKPEPGRYSIRLFYRVSLRTSLSGSGGGIANIRVANQYTSLKVSRDKRIASKAAYATIEFTAMGTEQYLMLFNYWPTFEHTVACRVTSKGTTEGSLTVRVMSITGP